MVIYAWVIQCIHEANATSPQKWVSYSRPPPVDDLILYLDAPGGFAFSKKVFFIKVVKFSVKQRSMWGSKWLP